jgi:hypothetical protein
MCKALASQLLERAAVFDDEAVLFGEQNLFFAPPALMRMHVSIVVPVRSASS